MMMMIKKKQEYVLNSYFCVPCCESNMYFCRCLRAFLLVTWGGTLGTHLHDVITQKYVTWISTTYKYSYIPRFCVRFEKNANVKQIYFCELDRFLSQKPMNQEDAVGNKLCH